MWRYHKKNRRVAPEEFQDQLQKWNAPAGEIYYCKTVFNSLNPHGPPRDHSTTPTARECHNFAPARSAREPRLASAPRARVFLWLRAFCTTPSRYRPRPLFRKRIDGMMLSPYCKTTGPSPSTATPRNHFFDKPTTTLHSAAWNLGLKALGFTFRSCLAGFLCEICSAHS